ncbi:formin-like protein 3 [Cynara cardunculus var. scolymus]|uniref:formin-like protein 3 n=1 Tax=Cynara cardunculus var. scolymus TaxID=59895 RepID=UPI000D6301C2|nr:formin-like protein 3 [Cynara cardunculus var. scolymus]
MEGMKRAMVRNPPPPQATEQTSAQAPNPPPSMATVHSPSPPPPPPPPSTVAVDTIHGEIPIAAPPLQMVHSSAIVPYADPFKKSKEMKKSSTVPATKEGPTSSIANKIRDMPDYAPKVHSSSDNTHPDGLFTSDSEEDEDLAPKAQTGEILMESEACNLENITIFENPRKPLLLTA